MLNRIKYYAWLIAAGILAALLAMIRSKSNKIVELSQSTEVSKHEANIIIAETNLARAKELHKAANEKFDDWLKRNNQ